MRVGGVQALQAFAWWWLLRLGGRADGRYVMAAGRALWGCGAGWRVPVLVVEVGMATAMWCEKRMNKRQLGTALL